MSREILRKLSDKITEVYDLDLTEELTEIFEDLVTHIKEDSERYWSLMMKLAQCEKERDEERREKEQAEYDKEYFAKELAKRRDGE